MYMSLFGYFVRRHSSFYPNKKQRTTQEERALLKCAPSSLSRASGRDLHRRRLHRRRLLLRRLAFADGR